MSKFENDGRSVFITSWKVQGEMGPRTREIIASYAADGVHYRITANEKGSIVFRFDGPDPARAQHSGEIFKEFLAIRKAQKDNLDKYQDLEERDQWAQATNAAMQSLYPVAV